MEVMGVEWDDGNWPKCAKHGVTKDEIDALLLGDPMILRDRSPDLAEARFNAVGRTTEGRPIFVVFAIRERAGLARFRPISARYMHAKEFAHYEQQQEGP